MKSTEWYTPPQVAKMLHISREKVLTVIRSGELVAADLASTGSSRPRYRVDQRDLDAFLMRRQVNVTPKVKRRRKRDPQVREYF